MIFLILENKTKKNKILIVSQIKEKMTLNNQEKKLKKL